MHVLVRNFEPDVVRSEAVALGCSLPEEAGDDDLGRLVLAQGA